MTEILLNVALNTHDHETRKIKVDIYDLYE